MSDPDRSVVTRLAARLIGLAAPEFRTRHADAWLDVFDDIAREARARHGRIGPLLALIAELPGLARLAWSTRRAARGTPAAGAARAGRTPMLDRVAQDLRYAVRAIRRAPVIATVTVLTIALGVGANTAIFSLVYGVLLKPLAYPHPERLYAIGEATTNAPPHTLSQTTPASFVTWRSSTPSAAGMAGYNYDRITITGLGEPESVLGVTEVGGLLDVLGVRPLFGRAIRAEDEAYGAEPVIVLAHETWQRFFGDDRSILGHRITVSGTPTTIIGVMPAGFEFPGDIGYWRPDRWSPEFAANRDQYMYAVVVRLRDGATPERLQSELATVATRLRRDWPLYNTDLRIDIQPLRDSIVDGAGQRLGLLMGAVALVLLIGCANVANLMLARASGRRHEMVVRQALGARWSRIVRQLLTENVLLALAGGIAAVLVGTLLMRVLVAAQRDTLPRADEIGLDPMVLAFTLAIAIAAGLSFGLAPAIALARGRSSDALRDGTRASEGRQRGRRALVVGELALAVMLLVGAGLLSRSFSRLTRVEPGLDTERLLTFSMTMPRNSPPQLVDRSLERLRAVPGVRDVAVVSQLPLTGRGIGAWFNIYGRPLPAGTTPPGEAYRVVSPGYFGAAQIPILQGRALDAHDGRDGTPSVAVNEALAHKYWPNGGAIGSEIYLGAPDNRIFDRATIVGIVGNTHDAGLGADPLPTVFMTTTLVPYWRGFFYVIRTTSEPMSVFSSVKREIRALAPDVPLRQVRTMDAIVGESVAPARWSLVLFGSFAAIALIMAALGVFGVLSYLVAQRTRELGIRLALGAAPSELRRMVVGQGIGLATIGIAIGVVGAFALKGVIATLLFGIGSTDPITYAAVVVVLLIVGALASWLPARRATRVDPVSALRS